MTGRHEDHQAEAAEEASPVEPLSDTQADLHEEGKSLSDHDKDLGEKLADIFERRGDHD